MNFILRWVVNIIALLIVIHVAAGVSAANLEAVIVAAFVLGLFNAFLRPLLIALTLPINILSFGLFTLVINGFLFYLVARFVKGFSIIGFWSAFWASIVFSVISFILNMALTPPLGFTLRTNIYGKPGNSARRDDVIDVEARIEGKEDKK